MFRPLLLPQSFNLELALILSYIIWGRYGGCPTGPSTTQVLLKMSVYNVYSVYPVHKLLFYPVYKKILPKIVYYLLDYFMLLVLTLGRARKKRGKEGQAVGW